MRIRELKIENFRGFESLTLELHPQCTLLVGANGAGKTSVLDALAVVLGSWVQGITGTTHRFREDDRRLLRMVVHGVPTLEIAGFTHVVAGLTLGDGAPFVADARFDASQGLFLPLYQAAQQLHLEFKAGRSVDFPVVAFYGTGRLWKVSKRGSGELAFKSVVDGYRECLDAAVGYQLLESWMSWRESVRLQEIGRAVETGLPVASVREPQLEAVAEAARSCVEGARRFYYSVNHQELRVDFEDGRTLPFRMLSDGYRNLLALAGDIAWRAARLNPHHGEHAAREATGVVLIDEIDLHLHPGWQRRVLPDLRRAFPKIQFIATTHSPQVLSTAEPEWIRVLYEDGRVERVAHTRGRDSNSLLEDVFRVDERPSEVRGELRRLFDLIDRGELEAAEALWRACLEHLGPNDPDLVRARTLIDLERGA